MTLKVFDITGREVAVVIEEEQLQGGHEIVWYPVNLPSGVYIYRLHAGGGYTTTKKLILLK